MSELTIFIPAGKTMYVNVSSPEDQHRFWLCQVLGYRVKTRLVAKPVSYLPGEQWWSLSEGNLDAVLTQGLRDFGTVKVTRRRYEGKRCDASCVKARLNACVCSCGGANHRGTTEGYHPVGSSTLVSGEWTWVTVTYQGKRVLEAAH